MNYLKKYSPYGILPVLLFISILFIHPGVVSSDNHPCLPGDTTGTCVESDDGDNDGGDGNNDGGDGNAPAESGKLLNPLESASIEDFLIKIIEVLLVFALPIIVLFIMYAGFLFVTARGNETQLTKAKSTLLWSIVGGVIALSAMLIINVLQETIKGF